MNLADSTCLGSSAAYRRFVVGERSSSGTLVGVVAKTVIWFGMITWLVVIVRGSRWLRWFCCSRI